LNAADVIVGYYGFMLAGLDVFLRQVPPNTVVVFDGAATLILLSSVILPIYPFITGFPSSPPKMCKRNLLITLGGLALFSVLMLDILRMIN